MAISDDFRRGAGRDFRLPLEDGRAPEVCAMSDKLREFAIIIRPRHWLKNFFVFAPLVFSGTFLRGDHVFAALVAFTAFCAASSAAYVFNDIRDAESDCRDPRKCSRPIPSGRVTARDSVCYFVILLFMSLGLTLILMETFSRAFIIPLAGYLVINLFYSSGGKRLFMIDRLCIAAGFVLRVTGGYIAIGEPLSLPVAAAAFFLALFLGFGKRRNEILHQSVGSCGIASGYSVCLLDRLMALAGVLSVVSYGIFMTYDAGRMRLGLPGALLTIPLVMYGMIRYGMIVRKGGGGDPTEILTGDGVLVLTILLWVIVTSALIIR